MLSRLLGSQLPTPASDIALFAITVGAFLGLWRLSGNVVDCGALLAAVGCAVALGWWDNYRRAKRWAESTPPQRSAPV